MGAPRHGPTARAAALFAALGDSARLRIVARLCDSGPLSIARLTEGGGITRQAVSKHLRALERAGLVQGGRRGRERIWRMRQRRLTEAQRYLAQVSAHWDAALARLRALVE